MIGGERAVAACVGVTALAAAGDDRMAGVAAGLEDRGVDDRAEAFGGERSLVELEPGFLVDAGAAEGVDTFGEADFGHHESGADFLDFLGGFEGAIGKKLAAPGV